MDLRCRIWEQNDLSKRFSSGRPQIGNRFESRTWNWRRRPDLNRGSRFCRPLPYHLATAPVGTECREIPAASRRSNNSARNSRSEPSSNAANVGVPTVARRALSGPLPRRATPLRRTTFAWHQSKGWSGKRDSNPRLRPWQGRTLPLSYSRSNDQSTTRPGRVQAGWRSAKACARRHLTLRAPTPATARYTRADRRTCAASSGGVGLM